MARKESPIDNVAKSPNFQPFMKKLALIGGVAAVAGLVMKLLGVPFGTPLTTMGMGMLALVAFMLGQLFPYPANDDEEVFGGLRAMWKFAMRLTGYSLAVAIMGFLFWLQHWPGSRPMLLIAAGSLVCCGLVWLYFRHLKKKVNNNH